MPIRVIDPVCHQPILPKGGDAVSFLDIVRHKYSINKQQRYIGLYRIERGTHWGKFDVAAIDSFDRGVATNFRLGGRNLTGGTDSGESKPPTPKFRFVLGSRPHYFRNIGKLKNFSENY